MARQLPAYLSYKSALALLPPSSIMAPIEQVRRVRDKHFARWPAHINLLYPFRTAPSEDVAQASTQSASGPNGEQRTTFGPLKADVKNRIRQVLASIEPFEVELSAEHPGTFSYSTRSKTVWLCPSTNRVQELQAALRAEFSECDADERHFTHHLSVGQATSEEGMEVLREEMKSSILAFLGNSASKTASLAWNIDRVHVMERKDFRSSFQVVDSIRLGESA
ncbi:hypothetical protein ACEQ8H_006014 [Pleosporales sp. CAS-2024a]